MLSPASAISSSLWNISIPVTTVFLRSSVRPMISTSSFILITPRSTRPVATVPRPEIEKTSSTGIRKGSSSFLSGVGIYSSTVFMSSRIEAYSGALMSVEVESRASRAEPRMIGVSSPGMLYSLRRSRTSI